MVRNLVGIFAVAFAVGACSRDTQPAADPQPAAPAPVADSGTEPVVAPGDEIAGEAPVVDGAGAQPQRPQQPGGAGQAPVRPAPQPGQPAQGGGQQPAPAAEEPQTDAQVRDGAAVLRRAAAAYENVRSMQADFVMNFENPLLRQRLTSRGTIYQRQPDRLAVRFSDPEGDLIVSDGQHFWMYYPSNNAQQVLRAPAGAAGETAVNLQAQFIGNPVERFDYTYEGTESVGGRTAHVLTLVPRQRAEYRALKVWLDDRDALARRFEITENNGSVRLFNLSGLQVNPSIPDAVFRFTPPPGVNVVAPR